MEIVLSTNYSEKNRINKTLALPHTLTGKLRDSCSLINPSFMVESAAPILDNYCYISDFNRYYFIDEVISYRENLWMIRCSVDVLMSYKDEILNLRAILSDTENNGAKLYLSGEQWKSSVKDKTDIITFPSGLLENGEYILITAGGVAAL